MGMLIFILGWALISFAIMAPWLWWVYLALLLLLIAWILLSDWLL